MKANAKKKVAVKVGKAKKAAVVKTKKVSKVMSRAVARKEKGIAAAAGPACGDRASIYRIADAHTAAARGVETPDLGTQYAQLCSGETVSHPPVCTEESSPEAMVQRRQYLKDQIKAMSTEKEELDSMIGVELINLGVADSGEAVRIDRWNVKMVQSKNTRLDRALLLDNGVPADVIEASTVVKPYTFVDIREAKD